jgi:hypothetical protein
MKILEVFTSRCTLEAKIASRDSGQFDLVREEPLGGRGDAGRPGLQVVKVDFAPTEHLPRVLLSRLDPVVGDVPKDRGEGDPQAPV